MSSSFFTKDFNEIEFQDIQKLVDGAIQESYNLEYKEDYPLNNRKLARSMIAFANASGGYIILGMKEFKTNNKNTGIPEEIIGIDLGDHLTKITNIALSNSQPNIFPKIRVIEHQNNPDKIVVLIKINESFEPIMDNSSNRFYIRINDKKHPADQSLVNKLFNKESYVKEKRIHKIFNIIKKNLEKMNITSTERSGDFTHYFYSLSDINRDTTDLERLNMQRVNSNELREIMLIFKDVLKYFGSNEENPLSLCLGRYKLDHRRIICHNLFITEEVNDLIPQILKDITKFCKDYFNIELI